MKEWRTVLDVGNLSRLGIRGRFVLIFYLVVVTSMTIVGFYGYQSAATAYRSQALQEVSQSTKDISVAMEMFLREVPADLQFVAGYYALERYFYWNDLDVGDKINRWRAATIDTFHSFLRSRDHYHKVRFLDAKGQEKITMRYDRLTGKVVSESEEGLQDKRHRPYFLESIQLDRGGLYVSAMDLNMEHGVIEKPLVPVVRFAQPVVGDNRVKYGVAVINVYADALFQFIRQGQHQGRDYLLISSSGDYLFHSQEDKAWGHQLGGSVNFSKEFPEIYRLLQDKEGGSLERGGRVIGFSRIYPHPLQTDTYWCLIAIMDSGEAMARLNHFIMVFAAIFAVTLVTVFVLSRRFIGGLMDPLLAISGQLERLGKGEIIREEITYGGDDEIGQMLRSSNLLVLTMETLSRQADRIAAGNYSESVAILSEQDRLGIAINNMTLMLRENQQQGEEQNWLTSGQAQLDNLLRGEQSVEEMADKIVTFLASHLQAAIGALYLSNDDGLLHLQASYAYKSRKNLANVFRPGEGMVGQAALEKKLIVISNVPESYIRVSSALGEKEPTTLVVIPFLYNDKVKAVLELGSFSEFDDLQLQFLEQISDRIAIAITSAQSRLRLQEILQITQQQSEELQSQQEELKATNEELEEQTQRLQASEEELRAKQDQLVTNNEELEEKNESLNQQKQRVEQANQDLELSRMEIERKADELAIASKYKSEFLANMSHELRTPLNSLLLLAQTLEENRRGNLTEDDIQSVKVIHNSGKDLLSLINEILDLSKIEAGQMELMRDIIPIADFLAEMKNTFQHLIDEKGLTLHFEVDPQAPQTIESDRKRLDQVMKNLLSNAVKFTDKGAITVSIGPVGPGVDLLRSGLQPDTSIAIAVQDSGVGIPLDKQRIIFEAFQQADGSTARRYGGTGLGLSISRDLAGLLGGEIQLFSKEGTGSTFTLYLPLSLQEDQPAVQDLDPGDAPNPGPVETDVPVSLAYIDDDRHSLQENDRIILVIEDDPNFAALLLQQCHEKGLKCLAVPTGEEGLQLAESYLPMAIILDLKLPGINGWQVLETLKDQIKTRHIPVHIISVDDAGIDAQRKGAIDYLVKPVSKAELDQAFANIEETFSRQVKDLLVAGHGATMRKVIVSLVGNNDVQSEEAASGQEVISKLQENHYDCLIMGLDLADMSGFSLLKQLKTSGVSMPPVIVYTGQELSRDEVKELRQYAESIIVKGVMSEERLLDESALFLHRMICKLPEAKQRMIRNLHEDDAVFTGKRILIVDDDMRNVFALAKVLQEKGIEAVKAEDGIRALSLLDQDERFDLVLMDIMMPGMDGYEAMERIRQQPQFKDLPIIALTAKAMKEDRNRCLSAGANDYLAKPVDMDRLLALLRVWLYR